MHVQIAAQVLQRHEAGKGALLRGVNLPPVFAKFRRHECEAQRLVDARLRLAGDLDGVIDTKEPVLVQFQATLNRTIAQGDVVGL